MVYSTCMNIELLKCPSCGASAKNHINCEYCGSLFVRFEEFSETKALVENIIDPEGKVSEFIFPGLINQIEVNLSLQKEKEGLYVTDIQKKGEGECLIQICSTLNSNYASWADIQPEGVTDSPGVSIHLPFAEGGNAQQEPIFKQMPESKLFRLNVESFEEEKGGFSSFFSRTTSIVSWNEYILDFGADSEGAAYIVSKILLHLNMYGIIVTKTSELEITTTEF